MKRICLALLALLLSACGVEPSGPTAGGEAPTGIAPGTTLYFVDARHELRPQLRNTGSLGTISEALSLLLSGPGGSGLHTEIASNAVPRVVVTTEPGVIRLLVPLTVHELSSLGIDQLVCTALDVHVRGGGPRNTKVRVVFTQPTPESEVLRSCPLIT
ncbi:hypothetical protein [Amycolatopsis sp. CA-230715]|uniref:hypothetical protein n=1 Tax=Amycolatopsis sp. CA-230715 TaxID=2745196 RepID=UPI001C0326F0|nr:hypothetical protein [Amycolatopsis sp. CA-230715]QWF84273.1 hypothetical protein HUW46_07723 [Amycolatopsis sp. CA-230715]